jgi:hypothetical protein
MNDKWLDDDALDRALFALELEEPPADLRASILSATAYRPAPAFAVWDFVLLGTLAAVAVWLIAWIVSGAGSDSLHDLTAFGNFAVRSLSNGTTLLWLAAGGATAIWLSVFTGSQPWALASHRSVKRTTR